MSEEIEYEMNIDPETGEIIDGKKLFEIDSDEKAEWYLRKRLDMESHLKALCIKKQAIIDNIDSECKQIQNKLDSFNNMFENSLAEFARKQIEGSKSKTYKTPYGKVIFRKIPASVSVEDKDKAVEWASENAPDTVKVVTTVSFSIKDFKANHPDRYEAMIEEGVHPDTGLLVRPERETVTVDTGVEKD